MASKELGGLRFGKELWQSHQWYTPQSPQKPLIGHFESELCKQAKIQVLRRVMSHEFHLSV